MYSIFSTATDLAGNATRSCPFFNIAPPKGSGIKAEGSSNVLQAFISGAVKMLPASCLFCCSITIIKAEHVHFYLHHFTLLSFVYLFRKQIIPHLSGTAGLKSAIWPVDPLHVTKDLAGRHVNNQLFIPPSTIPFMKYFCRKGYTARIGSNPRNIWAALSVLSEMALNWFACPLVNML